MIRYCYYGDYDDHNVEVFIEHYQFVSRINTNAGMYAIAEKYDMQGLKNTAKGKFDDLLSQPSCCAPIYSHSMPYVQLNSTIYHVAEVIQFVYNSTPDTDRGLRDSLVDFAQKHWEILSDVPNFEAGVSQIPAFLLEIIGRKPLEVTKPTSKTVKVNHHNGWGPTGFRWG